MPLPTPNLDDRRFQDIVDEAKRLIPRYCPEWTDHNVSDPGVTLIELFAWMTEMMIFRLNQVPDKSYVTFMELMGVKLQPPAAARAVLTCWLSAPALDLVRVPAGTEVSTAQTAAERAVSFMTDNELIVYPPKLSACLTAPDERTYEDQTWRLTVDDELFLAFSAAPQPGNAFYLAFDDDLSNNILELTIDCVIEGIGVDPANPPLSWEAWCNDGWTELELARDETGGLNKRGRVVLYLPPRMASHAISEHQGFWVRCRHTPPDENQPTYSASPRIQTIFAASVGGMVSATNAMVVANEALGRSDGKPGQIFHLERTPVLRRRQGETVEVENEQGRWEPWSECEHFGNSGPDDKHFCLDSVSGEISFGPAIREPDGGERQYGALPPRTRRIRFSGYRYGGGAAGNVGTGTLTVLRSTVSYVDRVTNRTRAFGGRDAETLERAKLRAPQMLRTAFRAVTVEDFEYLAKEASPTLARARCLQPGALNAGGLPPGTVQVLLVPSIPQPESRLLAEQLRPSPELIGDVQAYLDERRLLTTTVRVDQPSYLFVRVVVQVRAQLGTNPELLHREIVARLYRFINPLTGGADGQGWPFDRDLYISEIYTTLQGTPGLAYIEQASLYLEGTDEAQARIVLPPNGMIASGEHQITVI